MGYPLPSLADDRFGTAPIAVTVANIMAPTLIIYYYYSPNHVAFMNLPVFPTVKSSLTT